jgi:hypothetical protein
LFKNDPVKIWTNSAIPPNDGGISVAGRSGGADEALIGSDGENVLEMPSIASVLLPHHPALMPHSKTFSFRRVSYPQSLKVWGPGRSKP